MSQGIDHTTEENTTERIDRSKALAADKKERKRRRRSPVGYVRAVWAELRKVAWPTRKEVVRYSIVVLFTLVLMLGIIFALDFGFARASNFLFK